MVQLLKKNKDIDVDMRTYNKNLRRHHLKHIGIAAGIILVPQLKTAKELGYNMANYERLIRELPIFSQVITMPIVVIGFEGAEVE